MVCTKPLGQCLRTWKVHNHDISLRNDALRLTRSLTTGSKTMTRFSSSTSSSTDPRIQATRNWFRNIVIGEKLCPFAPPLLRDPELLRTVAIADTNLSRDNAIELVAQEVELLVDPSRTQASATDQISNELNSHETTLVVTNLPWLQDFRDMVRFSWDLQEYAIGSNYLSEIQLVLFHPLATHQTYGEEIPGDSNANGSASDYTIRSPYPTFHLLREVDVLKAVESGYPSLESLPARNQAKLRAQGWEMCHRRLQECYQTV